MKNCVSVRLVFCKFRQKELPKIHFEVLFSVSQDFFRETEISKVWPLSTGIALVAAAVQSGHVLRRNDKRRIRKIQVMMKNKIEILSPGPRRRMTSPTDVEFRVIVRKAFGVFEF